MGDGAGQRVKKCEMCTENDKKESGGVNRRSEGCRGAEHGQTCTKERTGAWGPRIALESDVQLGGGGDKKAKWANINEM
jgi:hypothetical protein